MKSIIAVTGLALAMLTPAAFAQNNDNNQSGGVTAGGSAGASATEVATYATVAAVGAGAIIAGAFIASNSGSDDKDVDAGAGGTGGTTGTN